jgi:hypothetical protein
LLPTAENRSTSAHASPSTRSIGRTTHGAAVPRTRPTGSRRRWVDPHSVAFSYRCAEPCHRAATRPSSQMSQADAFGCNQPKMRRENDSSTRICSRRQPAAMLRARSLERRSLLRAALTAAAELARRRASVHAMPLGVRQRDRDCRSFTLRTVDLERAAGASTRSIRPIRPLPLPAAAPPTPSWRTTTRRMPSELSASIAMCGP